MPGNKPRSQYKKKQSGFMVKILKKRTELLTVDMVKENNMAASLSIYVFHPILVTFTSIFLLEMMLKTVIMLD